MATSQIETEIFNVKVELPKELADAVRLAMKVDGDTDGMEAFLAHMAKDASCGWVECFLPDLYRRQNLRRFR